MEYEPKTVSMAPVVLMTMKTSDYFHSAKKECCRLRRIKYTENRFQWTTIMQNVVVSEHTN